MTKQLQPKYLNVADAAKYCGLSTRTLKRRIKEKRFRTFTQGRVLIDRESLDAWIEGKEQP